MKPPDLPNLAPEDSDEREREATKREAIHAAEEQPRRPFLRVLKGGVVGELHALDQHDEIVIGRDPDVQLRLDHPSVSRHHAKIVRLDSSFVLEDLRSANGTRVNGKRVALQPLEDGDQVAFGGDVILKFEYQDHVEETAQRMLFSASTGRHAAISATTSLKRPWSPQTWKRRPAAQAVNYENPKELAAVVDRLRWLPPLVLSWEVEELKRLLAEAQEGRRFMLQGGDCAETFADCNPDRITNKLKILLQMSLVLMHGAHRPVIRVGRFAGQYAKPRSSPTEIRDGVELPSYLGDLVNRPEFTPEARRFDPQLLLAAHQHGAMTLNLIRALSGGGFSDLKRPEYYDLSFFGRTQSSRLHQEHMRMSRQIAEALEFVTALGQHALDDLARAFFTSHEGLNLVYESAQTLRVPRREGFYDLTTHLPWIGDRTRALDGAHVEFFRGVANPVGVKLGPSATPMDTLELCRTLNPDNEPGKLLLIARMGAKRVTELLPPLIEAVKREGLLVLWVCDPMHGNTTKQGAVKTRNFDDILQEVELSIDAHKACGSHLGGVHFELTGEDVTECLGAGVTEQDLDKRYMTACDPRLNYRQAMEMAFSIARRLKGSRLMPTTPPPFT